MAKASPIQPEWIESTLFAQHHIRAIFTLRRGGISQPPFDSQNFGIGLGDPDANINENLRTFIRASALPSTPHQAIQIHQTSTLWCNGSGSSHPNEADILLSDQPDTPLAVRTADCLPILLADPNTGITAAAHAGWRGTASNVAEHAIQNMCERGAKKADILASLGPCIGPCCFQIGEEAATALKNCTPSASEFVDNCADLRQINRLQLLQCGLTDTNIELINACTACDNKRFFSFRRDAGQTGRHIAVVAIASKP